RRQMVLQSLRLAVLVRLRRLVWLWWRLRNTAGGVVPPRHDRCGGMALFCIPDRDDMACANLGAVCAASADSRDLPHRQNQSRSPAAHAFPRSDGRIAACSPARFTRAHLKMAAPAHPVWSTLARR